MKREIRIFRSHAEAERAERAYYRSLTPEQRLEILLELIARHRDESDEASEGFKRVYRITTRDEG